MGSLGPTADLEPWKNREKSLLMTFMSSSCKPHHISNFRSRGLTICNSLGRTAGPCLFRPPILPLSCQPVVLGSDGSLVRTGQELASKSSYKYSSWQPASLGSPQLRGGGQREAPAPLQGTSEAGPGFPPSTSEWGFSRPFPAWGKSPW